MVKRASTFKKIASSVVYFFFLLIVIILFDILVLKNGLGYGYAKITEEDALLRFPTPYVNFSGKPNALDHNEIGFRGSSFNESKPGDLKIAFWGGSTGYYGTPPIAKIIETKLKERLGDNIFVANYSVVASNHRQHLHGIIEYLPQHKPDIIIFYGGYNETIQSSKFDPRPGYPFNYFYRSETSPIVKLLVENSGIVGEIDRKLGEPLIGLKKLRQEQKPLSENWNKKIADKYVETLMLAKNIAGTIESNRFGTTKFLAFYQPYQVSEEYVSTHNEVLNHIDSIKYVHNVSSEFDSLGSEIYNDIVHVKQEAKELMAHKIADIVIKELQHEVFVANGD